jgi:hypothetical protein
MLIIPDHIDRSIWSRSTTVRHPNSRNWNPLSMEYLTIQEPRSTHFRGMEHHQSAYYGGQPRDDYSRQPRSSLDRSSSPSTLGPIDPAISNPAAKLSRWPAANLSGYYQHSTSPEQSGTSVSSTGRPAPRSIASLLQPEQADSAPKLKRMSGDEWSSAPQSAPVRSVAAPAHEPQSKDDRPTLPSFNAVCQL